MNQTAPLRLLPLALSLALPALSSSVSAQAAAPSIEAPALAVLKQGQHLCYSADVNVNNKKDAALSSKAEATLIAALRGLGLQATQYDAADTCDREVYYTFSVDVDGAPTIYQAALSLRDYVATDAGVALPVAQVWRDGTYGGNSKVLTKDQYTKIMTDDLNELLGELKADYASLKTR